MKLYLSLLVVSYFLCSFSLANTVPKYINVCGDGAGWPPFTYHDQNKKVVGYTVEVLTKILNDQGIEVRFKLPPWKRCLAETKRGGKYSISVDSSYSKQRWEDYNYSKSYYEITPSLFYFGKNYPNGFPAFGSPAELLKVGTVCGLHGYNYTGFLKGLKNSQVNMEAKDFTALVKKTKQGACRSFLARFEPLVVFKRIGQDHGIGTEIKRVALPGEPKEKFYFLISRKVPYSAELKSIIDEGIDRLTKSGELKKIYDKYAH
jgi:polar amino acid transport system substrate-binding protein